MRALIVVALLTASCASFPTRGPSTTMCPDGGKGKAPYVTEWAVLPFTETHDWFGDNGPTALTVHNPTDTLLAVEVKCNPSLDYGSIDLNSRNEWTTCIPAQSEKHRFVEFLNRDKLRKVCDAVASWLPHGDECAAYDAHEKEDY